MPRPHDNDSTDNDSNISLKDALPSRRTFMGMCLAAVAGVPAAEQAVRNSSDNANGRGLGETPPGQEDDDEDDEEEEEDEEPESDVVFEDQLFEEPTTVAIADKWEQNRQGYLSLHDYNRFAVAEDADLNEAAAEVAEEVDEIDEDEVNLEEPQTLENPICESMVGITERFDADEYEDFEVPVLREDSPAVELGPREAGPMEESEVLICIPHFDSTDNEEFVCPDDPDTPDVEENPEEVDGAYANGDQHVEDIGVSHDLGIVFIGTDEEENKGEEIVKKRLIEDGVLVPQALDAAEDVDEEEQEDDEEEEAEDDEADHPQVDEDVPTGEFADDPHGTLTINVTYEGDPAVRHPVEMNGDQYRTDENGQTVYELDDGHDNPTVIDVVVGDQEETAEVDHDNNDDVTLNFEV